MIVDYLKTSFRSIFKRKGYSLLNIAGLTIGMTCCLLIFHYVSYEKSYDDFEPHLKETVRVRLDSYQKGTLAYKSATSYPAIGPAMKKDFPEVQSYCRLIDNNLLLSNDAMDRRFAEDEGYYADPTVIDMFGIKLLKGNPKTALNGPDKILLSKTMAEKYFGNIDVLGKTLINRQGSTIESFEVTGVFKDFPTNSHLTIHHLVSYATLGKEMLMGGDANNQSETSWDWYDFYVYLQLKPGADYKVLETKLPDFADRYINRQQAREHHRDELHLIPLKDIHLKSNSNQEAEVNGSGQAVSLLFLIAIFIICIAWMNYINLATARSVERAKEVGVRKVLGAYRGMLIKQFLTEGLLINLISLLFSFTLFFLLLHPFDIFTGRSKFTGITLASNYWLVFFVLFVAGTFFSGLYPAFVLSGFKPVIVLKGAFKNSEKGAILRKSLIVTQFVISVVLIAGTIVVFMQVNYMRNQNVGVDINQTIVLKGPQSLTDSTYRNVLQPFKSSVQQLPSIKSITASSDVPGSEIYWTNAGKRLGSGSSWFTLFNLGVDYDFIPSYNIRMISGRNFSEKFGTDNKAVILNEDATKLLGFKDASAAVGEKIVRGDTLKVIGVASNFHQLGLQKSIGPLIMILTPYSTHFYSVKVAAVNMEQTISSLKKIWTIYFPKDPFDYYFLNEKFRQQYSADILFGKVFGVFALIAIIIACFGLLGLSSYNVLQRTKEIGIRKILGASLGKIFILLSRDFLKLVLISLLFAIPFGWYLMRIWLEDYAYHIDLPWWIFVVAGAIALCIAIVTISLQILKEVTKNPVNSLKIE